MINRNCVKCDCWYGDDDGTHTIKHRDGKYYCADCIPTIELRYQNKHKGLFNPDTTIKWKTFGKSNIYYGLELEMVYTESSEIETKIIEVPAKYMAGRHIWKYEGSLDEHGAELVLAPQTFKILHGNKFALLLQNLIKEGAQSYDDYGCGLHIHVNREAIPENTLSGIKTFFTMNKQFLQVFSRRLTDEWCHIPDTIDGWFSNDYSSKGIAINDHGSHTIEFRLFAGTLDRNEILGAVQLIDSLIQVIPKIRKESEYTVLNLYRSILNEPKYHILKRKLSQTLRALRAL